MIRDILKKLFRNWLVKDLYVAIDKDDILRIENGTMLYKGNPIDSGTVAGLKESADYITHSTLWKIMSDEAKYVACLRMFEKSRTPSDLDFGKALLYIQDLYERKLDEISKL